MERPGDLWRFAGANGITQLGTQVTIVALPLTAVLTLDAGAIELGLLSAAQMVAFLLIGLPAGVWVDRMRRRPILVWADLIRGAALLTVPLAAWLDGLTLPHLYAVALVLGVGTVFFDVAQMSFVPAIVPKERLERANGRLEVTRHVSVLAGPDVGGWLVTALTAPFALLADAGAYLVSAHLLSGIRAEETPSRERTRRLRSEMAEGVAFVVKDPVLLRVAIGGALTRVALGACAVGYPLYLVAELGVDATTYGLLLSASAVGALAGATVAARVTARLGIGPTLYGSALLTMVLCLPAVATGPGWRLLAFPVFSALAGGAGVVFNIAQLSHRQRITPERLLGRVNASMRFLMWGAMPVGGLAGGALGEWLGGYAVFAAGVAGLGLSYLAVVLAPRIARTTT
ncbi:MFS transporter [Nonomuraea basaltis]|uniref:MFS transporter n=1 Tax=Nonomuraea basaltis TaxID=2495887 RepID=UPI00110C43D3|nr:MFS transporter [Nonomuraea basaltis]TMS00764.1 MFS transporter [Nonomuraea basaltis]